MLRAETELSSKQADGRGVPGALQNRRNDRPPLDARERHTVTVLTMQAATSELLRGRYLRDFLFGNGRVDRPFGECR
jgi:hypothetical protein